MATAKKTKSEIEVTLVLNGDEAKFLLAIMGQIAGNPYNSPRKFADNIYHALRDLFPKFNSWQFNGEVMSNSVWIKDNSLKYFDTMELEPQ